MREDFLKQRIALELLMVECDRTVSAVGILVVNEDLVNATNQLVNVPHFHNFIGSSVAAFGKKEGGDHEV